MTIDFRLIKISLDTRQWAAGTYLMQISGKNAVLQTEKIEIIH